MAQDAKRCRTCGAASMVTSVEDYSYERSGLPNVVLLGIRVRRCSKCHAFEALIPRMDELHAAIASAVIRKKSRLNAAEVRFLRHYLGWTGVEMATHMGVDATTVSAWENDRKPFGSSSDRLLRLIVAHRGSIPEEYDVDELTEIADRVGRSQSVAMRPRSSGWQTAGYL